MLLQWACWGLIVIGLASQTGCHCLKCWPCGHTYCGSQCGELYWNEWFSLPPDCCDPCTHCGVFCGPNNRYLRRGVFAAHGGEMGPYADTGFMPTMADPGSAEEVPAGEPAPAADEELPPADMPDDAAMYDERGEPAYEGGGYYDELGQRIANDRPVDSRRSSRRLGRPPRSRHYVR